MRTPPAGFRASLLSRPCAPRPSPTASQKKLNGNRFLHNPYSQFLRAVKHRVNGLLTIPHAYILDDGRPGKEEQEAISASFRDIKALALSLYQLSHIRTTAKLAEFEGGKDYLPLSKDHLLADLWQTASPAQKVRFGKIVKHYIEIDNGFIAFFGRMTALEPRILAPNLTLEDFSAVQAGFRSASETLAQLHDALSQAEGADPQLAASFAQKYTELAAGNL